MPIREFIQGTMEQSPIRVPGTAFFLSRKDLVVTKGTHMSIWQKRLFVFLSRNAAAADRFFRLPHEQVIELGVQLEL